ncbi:MAG TPA: hypothetical protein PLF40_08795 [Kofleriaceae bacterium]|nr:hypothetical protein [Kofleriaceae bacterium]
MSTADKQVKEPELPKKQVSGKALGRLAKARDAIAATKRVLNFGAGNQMEAIGATKMNSNFRLKAMREPSYWTLAPDVQQLAQENPEALVAAQADLVHGGNCGEHAYIAYDYLRRHAKGEHIAYVYSTIDHCFVHIGDKDRESAAEVAVSDPWPTQATACLWEDHFCFTTDVQIDASMKADGKSLKGAIAHGLRLSEEGKAAAAAKATDAETHEALLNRKENHFWQQPDTADEGKKFHYTK